MFGRITVADLRRHSLAQILAELNIRRILIVGCGEGEETVHLCRRLYEDGGLTHVVAIDIDGPSLPKALDLVRQSSGYPLRDMPLHLKFMKGDIMEWDSSLVKLLDEWEIEAAVALEVIEHVYEDKVDCFMSAILGRTSPKYMFRHVIVSTPNGDYNLVFPSTTLNECSCAMRHRRHDDHKFEWPRRVFQARCDQWKGESFTSSISGIGEPSDREIYTVVERARTCESCRALITGDSNCEVSEGMARGFLWSCSQMCVFTLLDQSAFGLRSQLEENTTNFIEAGEFNMPYVDLQTFLIRQVEETLHSRSDARDIDADPFGVFEIAAVPINITPLLNYPALFILDYLVGCEGLHVSSCTPHHDCSLRSCDPGFIDHAILIALSYGLADIESCASRYASAGMPRDAFRDATVSEILLPSYSKSSLFDGMEYLPRLTISAEAFIQLKFQVADPVEESED